VFACAPRPTYTRTAIAVALAAFAVACGGSRVDTVPSPAGVRTHTETTYYPVTGADVRAWRASMFLSARSAGVEAPFAAQTSWRTQWSYASTRASAVGCELVSPAVELDVRYIMPQLVPDSAGSPEDRAEWHRHLAALWTHEKGHALRGTHAAAAIRDALRHIRVGSCALVAAEARRVTDEVIAKYHASDKEYDELSKHGARQGATLVVDRRHPVPIDTSFVDTGLNGP
jgi:predicted secreted Zn-dependent protease